LKKGFSLFVGSPFSISKEEKNDEDGQALKRSNVFPEFYHKYLEDEWFQLYEEFGEDDSKLYDMVAWCVWRQEIGSSSLLV
jgi:hypothetical protein